MQEYRRPRELGQGLTLRWSTERDVERIAEFAAYVFREAEEEPLNTFAAAWIRELGSGRHPLTTADQGLIVEDTQAGHRIVASLWLIPTTWTLEGISFGVGRPEEVATHPAYRRRGLVRALFDAFHARSQAEGQLIQAITGIPYYYRQFGYEYALGLRGERPVRFADLPVVHHATSEPYAVRDANWEDLPFVRALYDQDRCRNPVSTEIPTAYWEWMVDGTYHPNGWRVLVIVDQAQVPCGYLLIAANRWGTALGVVNLAVRAGLSLLAVLPPVLRALRAYAPTLPAGHEPTSAALDHLIFQLGAAHPVYVALGTGLAPHSRPPDAWYVRVADLPGFIRHLAPVLERRLAHSIAAGHSGELTVDLYRGGLHLVFERGRLMMAEAWQAASWGRRADAGCPALLFVQLLFGWRSLSELRSIFPDVWASEAAQPLLETLFPGQPSFVLQLN
jgi:predicted N-acetyltransferase YhbS